MFPHKSQSIRRIKHMTSFRVTHRPPAGRDTVFAIGKDTGALWMRLANGDWICVVNGGNFSHGKWQPTPGTTVPGNLVNDEEILPSGTTFEVTV
jgi:hypothetical protein